ncbi:hypothetical protein H4R24_001918 [Coemansia sp. RSA 988]|nr:hypothetical protein H4R24_001918 [Coemansia sp. RSA 988]
MHSIASTLPSRIQRRIFEYIFWVGASGINEVEQIALPIGQFEILPSLSVNHIWRRRAAGLFYRTAVIAIGTSDIFSTVVGPRRVRTNIQLILESGYAPKATQLVLLTIGHMVDLPECLLACGFSTYVWPAIDTLYFLHPPQKISFLSAMALDVQDEAIDRVNQYLAESMPALSSIYALSGTSDSFDLFVLDDLIDARMPNLHSLVAVSQGSLKLGLHGDALSLMQLTMRTIPQCPTSLTSAASVKRISEGDTLMDGSYHTENAGRAASGVGTVGIPHVFAESLVSLDIGPILPEGIWSPFFGINEDSGSPDPQTIADFACLRYLRLVFANPLATHGEASRRKSRQANRHHASPGPDNAVVNGQYPLFPKLESLKVEGYPYNIVLFLENFPRSRLHHLELLQCSHKFYHFSLEAFANLRSAVIYIPDSPHARREEDEETWIARLFSESAPKLRSLCLNAASIEDQVDFPAQCYRIDGLIKLELNIGIRSVEIEKLLSELKCLRSLHVVITDVLNKTHEYLSRNLRRKKYPKHKRLFQVSTSLIELSVRLLHLSPARARRALAKIAWIAARSPSILCIRTQKQHLHMLKACIENVVANKSAPVNISHINTLQLFPLVE